MPTIAYHTLGCKVNQYETEQIRQSLESRGFVTVAFSSRADAYIINTCTVTSIADGKSRAAVRRARRLNPDALLVITGCYADLDPTGAGKVEGPAVVISNEEKESIPERIARELSDGDARNAAAPVPRPRMRTRAIVKVQDGCDQFCSYCVVPFARRIKTSRPPQEIITELGVLTDFGHKEVVLTGIRLGSYEQGGLRLADLVNAAAGVEGIRRIRLSSVEPWEVDDALLDAIDQPKVCRHLHIPLQSGDDEVLRRMNRPYDSAGYLDLIERVRGRIDGIGITTDVIAGFPGETEAAFENTCAVVEAARFSRLHVFRYSCRAQTRAAGMPDQVDAAARKARAQKLAEMGRIALRQFTVSMVGRTLEVLVEHRGCAGEYLVGFADNYLKVRFEGSASLVGEIVPVEIVGACQDGSALGKMRLHAGNAACGKAVI